VLDKIAGRQDTTAPDSIQNRPVHRSLDRYRRSVGKQTHCEATFEAGNLAARPPQSASLLLI